MSGEVTPAALSVGAHRLHARRIGIDTQHEAVVLMHKDCSVCRSEGFTAHTRILLRAGQRHVIATLYQVTSDLVAPDEAALSESAWARLRLHDGATITVSHADSVESMGHVRSRIHGQPLPDAALQAIVADVVDGRYSDIQLSSFVTAPGADVQIDGWGGETVKGKVVRVDPAGFLKVSALGIEEQRVRTTIDFAEPPEAWARLGHDYRVIVHVLIWSGDDVLTVPVGALFRNGNEWAVYAARDGRARTTAVKIGHRNAQAAEVLSGLAAGDRVVLHPSDRVRDGAAVAQREMR